MMKKVKNTEFICCECCRILDSEDELKRHILDSHQKEYSWRDLLNDLKKLPDEWLDKPYQYERTFGLEKRLIGTPSFVPFRLKITYSGEWPGAPIHNVSIGRFEKENK